MNFDEFIQKSEEISIAYRTTGSEEARKTLRIAYFDNAIDLFHLLCEDEDYRLYHLEEYVFIFNNPRRKNMGYNETPTKGIDMSETVAPTPKKSILTNTKEKIAAMKADSDSAENITELPDKAAAKRLMIKSAAILAGIGAAITAVVIISNKMSDEDETDEESETTED